MVTVPAVISRSACLGLERWATRREAVEIEAGTEQGCQFDLKQQPCP